MFRRLTRLELGIDLGVAVAYAVAVVVFGVGWTTTLSGVLVPLLFAGALAVPLLLAGALAVRRLSPALALGLAWAGALLQMAAASPPGWADIAICAVVFATAAYGDRVTYWAGLASAIGGGLVATGYIALTQVPLSSDRSGLIVAAVLAAVLLALLLSWTAGALARSTLRARASRAAEVVARAETAASGERERIARDMHDVVAHSLAVVIAQADGARYAAAADPDAATRALGTISQTARAALADVRLLLTQLRHRQGDGPQPTLADLDELYAGVRAAGVALDVDVDPAPRSEPPAGVQLAVYRILQEALTNALRHGAGAPVDVALSWYADRVEVTVRNRMPVGSGARGSGHGIVGMGERAQLVGGRLDAGDADGQFVVTAVLPTGGEA